MNLRMRKLIGGSAMLIFVIVYALVAMALADSRPMAEAPDYLRYSLYVVLGLVWVVPLFPLIKWMERRPRP